VVCVSVCVCVGHAGDAKTAEPIHGPKKSLLDGYIWAQPGEYD